jgi:hypothetical protein
MSVLDQLACAQNRRDEVPNQMLAKKLVENSDTEGIAELVRHVWDKNPSVQSDCIKVLYEIGYLSPELIAPYIKEFIKLLASKHNRMVWGTMLALSTIAHLHPDYLYENLDVIKQAMADGSVITVDNGVKVLSTIAAAKLEYSHAIFPYLLRHLRTCRSKEVPQHSESILAAVNKENCEAFIASLQERMPELTPSQATRVKKTIQKAKSL